jgi:uncharacterized protein
MSGFGAAVMSLHCSIAGRAPYTGLSMNGSARTFDPRRLDIALAARNRFESTGSWPLAGFERLREGDAAPEGQVRWAAAAYERPRAGAPSEVRLRLTVTTDVERVCQRCLQPVRLSLEVQREFLFVADEDRAAELDADNDAEDVLELTRFLDLHALVEDELVLALPLVPRHEVCPEPLLPPASAAGDEAPQAHPFAALARLRRPGDA